MSTVARQIVLAMPGAAMFPFQRKNGDREMARRRRQIAKGMLRVSA